MDVSQHILKMRINNDMTFGLYETFLLAFYHPALMDISHYKLSQRKESKRNLAITICHLAVMDVSHYIY